MSKFKTGNGKQVSEDPVELSRFVLLHLSGMQLLGLCPVSLRLAQGHKCKHSPGSHSRWPQLIWMAVHLVGFAALHCYTYLHRDQVIYIADNFGKFNDMCKLTSAMFAHFITLFETLLKRRQLHDFLQRYSCLHKAWATHTIGQEAHIYRRFVLYCSSYLLLTLVSEFNFFIQLQHRIGWIVYFIAFMPSVLICRFRLMQFMFFLELVDGELAQLNRRIVRLATYTRSLYKEGMRIEGRLESELHAELRALLQTYDDIYEMVELLKDCSSWSVVAVYIKSYIKILCDSYWSYWCVFTMEGQKNRYAGYALIVPTIVNLIQLFLTARYCARTVNAVAHNLHKMRHQVEDLKMSARVVNFSLQILHQPIRIDMHGLFVINCQMIRGMLGSMATFMLFYIQFMPKFRNF